MKVGLLSDIHANLPALEAVHEHAKKNKVKTLWLLGDIFGRGPFPIEVLEWIQKEVKSGHWVLGNHDMMVAGLYSEEDWQRVNTVPKKTALHHREEVNNNGSILDYFDENFTQARVKPKKFNIDNWQIRLAHGGLSDPGGKYRYVYPWTRVLLNDEFDELSKSKANKKRPGLLCFGHTHVPFLAKRPLGASNGFDVLKMIPMTTYPLDKKHDWIVNPGSVGQPRDLWNWASYIIFDTKKKTVTLHKINYPRLETEMKLVNEEYDYLLVERLNDAMAPDTITREWREHFERIKGENDDL